MTQWYDANVRHSIYIERYKARLAREIVGKVNALGGDLFAFISESDLENMTRRQLNALLNEVSAIVDDGYAPIVVKIEAALKEFAVYEAGWQADTLVRAGIVSSLGVPSDADLWAAMFSRPFQGRLLREWLRDLSANTARRVRQLIQQGYVDGRGAIDIARELRGTRSTPGIMSISARGSEAMVRTAIAHTASAARSRTYQANPRIRGEQWVSVLDHRTSAICRGRDGTIYEKGKGPRPPAHVGCLTGDSLVSASPSITGASKRWFNGEVITVKTAGGRKLTCTPNHPILTDKGWVAAGDLDFSHKIACRSICEAVSAVDAKDNNTEPCISDVTEAFFAYRGVAAVPVPISAPDFHGDGTDGEIAIVGAYRGLGIKGNAEVSECVSDARIVSGYDAGSRIGGFNLFSLCLDASCGGFVGVLRKPLDFFRRCAIHARFLLLGPVSRESSVANQNGGYDAWPHSELISYGLNADATIKHNDGLFSVDANSRALMLANGRNISSPQGSEQNGISDADLGAYLLGGDAFNVELDGIVDLDRVGFSGHVYNLETVDGYYLSDNIITHNCRSTMIPVTIGNKAGIATRVTYNDWLKRQPESVQDDILGVAKARLFRDGGYTVDRFIDRAGNEYTLDELRAKDRETWNEVFGE